MKRSAIALFAALAVSCGDGLLDPTFDGSIAGAPTPTPRPGATATPTPTATPTATPAGTCPLTSMPDCGLSGCCSSGGGNSYVTDIHNAQSALERERPDIFNSNGSLRLDEVEYTVLLARRITQLTNGQVCARGGGAANESISKDEIGLKRDNGSSTNVDVIIGSSHTPYVGGVYNCRPASF